MVAAAVSGASKIRTHYGCCSDAAILPVSSRWCIAAVRLLHCGSTSNAVSFASSQWRRGGAFHTLTPSGPKMFCLM